MADQKPLHYLLGLEGAALLRAYAGEHDRAFAEARVARSAAGLRRAGAGAAAGRPSGGHRHPPGAVALGSVPHVRTAAGEGDGWPWSLLDLVPDAARAVAADTPVAALRHFRTAGTSR